MNSTAENSINLAPDMPEKDKLMAELILKRVMAFGNYRKANMVEIRANIAYLCGNQNIQVVGGHIAPLEDDYATRVVANKILPAVTNDLAVATKTSPKYDIVPDTTDETDRATAKAGEQIVKYLQKINGMDLKRKDVVLWYDIAGVGWRKVYWDPYYAIQGYNPPEGDPAYNPELSPGEPIYQGEVVVKAVPNSELVFDYRCKDATKLKWMIHTNTISIGEAKSMFGPEALQGVDLEQVSSSYDKLNEFETEIAGNFMNMAVNLGSSSANANIAPGYEDDKTVTYYEFWQVPSTAMPVGAFVVMLGNKVIINEPFPIEAYPHKRLPFIPAVPIQLTGISPRAISRITQARPLQREYNELRSMILDNTGAMGNSVFMAPRGSKIEYKRLDNRNGNIVEYDGPYKPSREQGVPLPGTIFAHMAEVKQSIDEVFSFPAPSRGMVERGGPDSGKGLQLLQDASHTQLGPMVNGFDEADQEVVFQALSIALANYGERVLPILGDDNAWVHYKLNTSDLNGRFTVTVKTGSSLPINKAVEAEKAFMLWESGLIGDPQSPETRLYTLRNMDAGNLDGILQKNAKQVNFAQKEFEVAEQQAAQMPPLPPDMDPENAMAIMEQFLYMPHPNSFDDHMVHIEEHRDWILDKYWKYRGEGLPQMQILAQAMLAHVEEHKMFVQQQAQGAQNAQMMQEAFVKGQTLEQIMAKQASDFEKIKKETKTEVKVKQ